MAAQAKGLKYEVQRMEQRKDLCERTFEFALSMESLAAECSELIAILTSVLKKTQKKRPEAIV